MLANAQPTDEEITKAAPMTLQGDDALHGGDVQQASEQYGIAIEDWIDLSTGLNPYGYDVNNIPQKVFRELPYVRDEFIQAAKQYYECENLLAVNGTQMAIQALPSVLAKTGIVLPSLGYQEHVKHWQKSNQVSGFYDSSNADLAQDQINRFIKAHPNQHLLIINPNNPSGLMFSPQQIQNWAQQLEDGAYIIVDEAFMDLTPSQSVLSNSMAENMIVLRSFGKFFGLAGIRLGFVFSNAHIIQQLESQLGLWSVNGPAQYIATQAFTDRAWQRHNIDTISKTSETNREIFSALFLSNKIALQKQVHSGLFSSYWLPAVQAKSLQDFFAKRGILIRLIPVSQQVMVIRIGLPLLSDAKQAHRVGSAIKEYLTNES